jgi:hypothetical protein
MARGYRYKIGECSIYKNGAKKGKKIENLEFISKKDNYALSIKSHGVKASGYYDNSSRYKIEIFKGSFIKGVKKVFRMPASSLITTNYQKGYQNKLIVHVLFTDYNIKSLDDILATSPEINYREYRSDVDDFYYHKIKINPTRAISEAKKLAVIRYL